VTVWLALVLGGLLTLAFKASFTLLGDSVRLPATVEAASAYVAPAMMAALAARAFTSNVQGPAGVVAIPAGAVAVLVATRTRSLAWTVAVGVLAYIAIDAALSVATG
jgi:branched-subunit amino acid transport protein